MWDLQTWLKALKDARVAQWAFAYVTNCGECILGPGSLESSAWHAGVCFLSALFFCPVLEVPPCFSLSSEPASALVCCSSSLGFCCMPFPTFCKFQSLPSENPLCLGPGGPHTAPTNLTEVNSSLHPLQPKVWNVSHWFEVSVLLLHHSARSQNSRAGRDFEVWGHGYKWSLQLWYKIGNVSKRDQDQVFSVFISSWKGPWGFLLPTGYCGTHFEDHLSRQALLFHGWKNLVSETRRRAVIWRRPHGSTWSCPSPPGSAVHHAFT